MNNRVAVIFAGGKSSRMGQDKSLLPFGDCPTLAQYQYKRLSQLFDKVYISAKSDKFDFEVDIIEDCYKESSPLVGIVSVFKTLGIDEVFVLSVDAPFVDREIIKKLYQDALPSKDAIIAKSPHGMEPLCAIYRRAVLPLAKAFLAEDNHRLQALLKRLDTQEVVFHREADFLNLNHPEEYQKAMSRLIDSPPTFDESSSL